MLGVLLGDEVAYEGATCVKGVDVQRLCQSSCSAKMSVVVVSESCGSVVSD